MKNDKKVLKTRVHYFFNEIINNIKNHSKSDRIPSPENLMYEKRDKTYSSNIELDSPVEQIIPVNGDIFKLTTRITLELSNICNYSLFHKKCPLSLEREKIILSSKIVYAILDVLGRYNYKGQIAFHNYNEPLIDPRLFKFIEYSKQKCPNSLIYFSTNGFYLNQIMVDELIEIGLNRLHISAYNKNEYERLKKINIRIPHSVELLSLDERLNKVYNSSNGNNKNPCLAPLNEIIINRDAKISLCCLDWQRRYSFGDLHNQTLEEIIRDGNLINIYNRLSRGDRFLDICKGCNWSR